MVKRRTEHCWPVAHSLADLQDVIPDPASFEAGSVLRIERIMLPDVHLQLVKEIADRFCPANGWRTIYLVSNKYRSEDVGDGVGTAIVVSTMSNQKKSSLEALQEVQLEVEEEGLKPLVILEGGKKTAYSPAILTSYCLSRSSPLNQRLAQYAER